MLCPAGNYFWVRERVKPWSASRILCRVSKGWLYTWFGLIVWTAALFYVKKKKNPVFHFCSLHLESLLLASIYTSVCLLRWTDWRLLMEQTLTPLHQNFPTCPTGQPGTQVTTPPFTVQITCIFLWALLPPNLRPTMSTVITKKNFFLNTVQIHYNFTQGFQKQCFNLHTMAVLVQCFKLVCWCYLFCSRTPRIECFHLTG